MFQPTAIRGRSSRKKVAKHGVRCAASTRCNDCDGVRAVEQECTYIGAGGAKARGYGRAQLQPRGLGRQTPRLHIMTCQLRSIHCHQDTQLTAAQATSTSTSSTIHPILPWTCATSNLPPATINHVLPPRPQPGVQVFIADALSLTTFHPFYIVRSGTEDL